MSFFKSDEQKLDDELRKQELLKKKIAANQARMDAVREKREEKLNTVKLYSIIDKQKKSSPRTWITYIKRKWFPEREMLIHMELANGFHCQFIAFPFKGQFTYNKAVYILDDALKYYDVAAKLWCLDYHQDFALPVKRKIPLTNLKKIMLQTGITDVETAVNPFTLKDFITSEVIQKVMKGDELDKVFKFIKGMLVIICIICAVHLVIFVQVSGILKNIHLPF